MSKDPFIPRRNKVNWHYVRDDHMFSTIKLVFKHQNTQQFGALLPIKLKNEEIRNSNAYKEYYAIATGAAPPKPKASATRTRSSSDTSITPLTVAASPRLTALHRANKQLKRLKPKFYLLSLRVLDAPTDEPEEELSWNSTNVEEGYGDDDEENDDGEDGDDDDDDQEVERDDDKDNDEKGRDDQEFDKEEHDEETRDEESFDPIPRTPKNSEDESNDEEDLGLIQSSSMSSQFMTSMLNLTLDKINREQVKKQVKVQVSKILPMIEQAVNEQLEAEVLTRSSHSSRTSYALGEAYKSDKIILDTYGDTVTLKRRRDDDADKDEEPSARPDQGSNRHREGKDPESTSAPTETATRSTGRSTQGSRSRQALASESALAEEPMQTNSQMEEPSHPEFDIGAEDQLIVQSSQHPEWFSQQQKPSSSNRAWNKTVLESGQEAQMKGLDQFGKIILELDLGYK
nr:hypothetical protein [Tanacetum cinerariifolium]